MLSLSLMNALLTNDSNCVSSDGVAQAPPPWLCSEHPFSKRTFQFPLAFDPLRVAVAAAPFSILERFSQDNMAAAAGHYYGDGGRATKRQKTENDGMATVISSY